MSGYGPFGRTNVLTTESVRNLIEAHNLAALSTWPEGRGRVRPKLTTVRRIEQLLGTVLGQLEGAEPEREKAS